MLRLFVEVSQTRTKFYHDSSVSICPIEVGSKCGSHKYRKETQHQYGHKVSVWNKKKS